MKGYNELLAAILLPLGFNTIEPIGIGVAGKLKIYRDMGDSTYSGKILDKLFMPEEPIIIPSSIGGRIIIEIDHPYFLAFQVSGIRKDSGVEAELNFKELNIPPLREALLNAGITELPTTSERLKQLTNSKRYVKRTVEHGYK